MGQRTVTTDVAIPEPVPRGHEIGHREARGDRISAAAPPGRADQCITAMAMSGVAALTAMGWVLSYAALRQLALSAGMATWAATLWPLCVDVFVFVATLAAIADRRRGRPTSYAWALAVAYSAATVAGNVAVAGTDHVAQAVHATPAVTMVLAWHLLSRLVEGRSREPRPLQTPQAGPPRSGQRHGERREFGRPGGRRGTPSGPDLVAVASWVDQHEKGGRSATGDDVAARFGVSGRTGRRWLVGVRGTS
jgi:hypothetical protein